LERAQFIHEFVDAIEHLRIDAQFAEQLFDIEVKRADENLVIAIVFEDLIEAAPRFDKQSHDAVDQQWEFFVDFAQHGFVFGGFASVFGRKGRDHVLHFFEDGNIVKNLIGVAVEFIAGFAVVVVSTQADVSDFFQFQQCVIAEFF